MWGCVHTLFAPIPSVEDALGRGVGSCRDGLGWCSHFYTSVQPCMLSLEGLEDALGRGGERCGAGVGLRSHRASLLLLTSPAASLPPLTDSAFHPHFSACVPYPATAPKPASARGEGRMSLSLPTYPAASLPPLTGPACYPVPLLVCPTLQTQPNLPQLVERARRASALCLPSISGSPKAQTGFLEVRGGALRRLLAGPCTSTA